MFQKSEFKLEQAKRRSTKKIRGKKEMGKTCLFSQAKTGKGKTGLYKHIKVANTKEKERQFKPLMLS